MHPTHSRLLLGACVLLGLTLAHPVAAQSKALLYDAYLSASVYPESFDHYAQAHPALKSQAFWHCFNAVQINLALIAKKKTEHCAGIPDIIARQKCRETDEGKISFVLDGMAETIRGERAFPKTTAGIAGITGKQLIGAGAFEQLQRQYVPMYRPLLMCP